MSDLLLRLISCDQIPSDRSAHLDSDTLAKTQEIVERVRTQGEQALRDYALRFGDLEHDQPLCLAGSDLEQALGKITKSERELLERTAQRIRSFAQTQRDALREATIEIPGGKAGHTVIPLESAACYAPGGRYPLPSSVLMTAVTARTAGVETVWAASPRPTAVTLAAAAIAEVEGFLQVGGAQAVAALAYGAGPVPRCDIIVGPGNRWVTAAKQLVSAETAIDLLAGPSELVIVADQTADPELIAADLLAQAEHDTDALPILVTLDGPLVHKVDAALKEQLQDLPTAETAAVALKNGFCLLAEDRGHAISLCNELAPEHLQLMLKNPEELSSKLTHYGALFIGSSTAEVFGDYGAGPNHVLPTGGTARFTGGLSVFNFLRVHTWLRMEDSSSARALIQDSHALALLEGLHAHARAAEKRLKPSKATPFLHNSLK